MSQGWWVGMDPGGIIAMAENRKAGALGTYGVVVGIDPGSEGYIVALSLHTDQARVARIASTKFRGVPVVDLSGIARTIKVPAVCWIEGVHGRGGWSATSNFSFGAYTGGAASVALQLGWELKSATPQEWQAGVHVVAPGKAKERSLATYHSLYAHDPLPRKRSGVLDHNAVDALLIATYGVRCLGLPLRRWVFRRVGK